MMTTALSCNGSAAIALVRVRICAGRIAISSLCGRRVLGTVLKRLALIAGRGGAGPRQRLCGEDVTM